MFITTDGSSKNDWHSNVETFFKMVSFLAYVGLYCHDFYGVWNAQDVFKLVPSFLFYRRLKTSGFTVVHYTCFLHAHWQPCI